MTIERKYGAGATISFPLIEFSLTSFHNSVTTTIFAAGDFKISKDYADFTNTATLPSSCPGNISVTLSLTAAELQASHIHIQVKDQTVPKVWEDQAILVETFGDTTASQFQFDRSSNTVVVSNLGASATAQINAEMVDVIRTDTVTELSSIPAASPDLQSMIQFLYMDRRNASEVTSSKRDVKNDAGSTIGSALLSDNGTTFSQGKLG